MTAILTRIFLSLLSGIAVTNAEMTTDRYIRKGLKPSDWRYLGLLLTPSPHTDTLPTILPTYILSLIQTAQTATLGIAGGAYNVDVLSTHPSLDGKGWEAVLRVDARHGQDLSTCLSMLPSPEVSGVKARLRVVGPTTALQTVRSLLS